MTDSQALLYAVAIYIFGFIMLFGNYGSFTRVTLRWTKKPKKVGNKLVQPKLSVGETIKCYIPMYQVYAVRKALYKRATVTMVLMIVSSVFIIANLLNKFVYAINSYVMFYCSIAMFIGVILLYFTYAFVTADCAKMYGFSWFTILLCFLFPHLFCWYLTNNIPRHMKQVYKEEVFNERNGGTVIRQKHSK